MFDALSEMSEGKNINRKMTLRPQLKNVKMEKEETMQSYFTRVSQIKEQLEAICDKLEDTEVVMTTLNCFLRHWDSFIQGICTIRKLTRFSKLWEECVQEEAGMINRDEKLQDKEDQALVARMKKGKKNKRETHSPKIPRRPQRNQKTHRGPQRGPHRNHEAHQDHSSFKCFNCNKMGHIAKNCPLREEKFKKESKKRYHAYTAEEDEPVKKLTMEDEESSEEYSLISALISSVTHGCDTWLMDSGSKHMIG